MRPKQLYRFHIKTADETFSCIVLADRDELEWLEAELEGVVDEYSCEPLGTALSVEFAFNVAGEMQARAAA